MIVGVGAAVACLAVPLAAQASTPGELPEWAVEDIEEGPTLDAALAEFRDCPDLEEFPVRYPSLLDGNGDPVLDEEGNAVPDESAAPLGRTLPGWCIKITAYNGTIKLGNTVAEIDPIEIVIGLNTAGDLVIAEGDGGGPAEIKIPGGITGIPALDPITDLTLGLLSVSATPRIGAPFPGSSIPPPDCEGLDCVEVDPFTVFGGWALQLLGSPHPIQLSVPLSIDLNNVLFGPNCDIDEFNINLTTGTTTPPEGVEPLTGDKTGQTVLGGYRNDGFNSWAGGNSSGIIASRVGTTFVDNTFAVPGPTQCDLLIGGLLNQPWGLFDGLIGSQVGLPSPAGQNTASFNIDVHNASYDFGFLYGAAAAPLVPLFPGLPIPGLEDLVGPKLEFGNVAIGSSKTLTATITNVGHRVSGERDFETSEIVNNAAGQFEITRNACAGVKLAPGDSCEIDVAYTPTSSGSSGASLEVPIGAGGMVGQNMSPSIGLTGSGI